VTAAADVNRRRALSLMLGAGTVVGGGLLLSACHKADASQQVLHVGDQKGGVRALLTAAGELKNVPYKIEWSDMPAAAPLLEAMSAGAIDIGSSSAPPFIFAYSNGAQIRAIMVTRIVDRGPEAGRGSAIIVPANSPLKALADLRGKKLATVKGSIGHDLALRLLDKAAIPFKDVQFVFLTNGDAKAALGSGAVDAWSTWAPYTGLAVVENGDRPLADARDLPDQGGGFMSASVKALQTKKPLLRDFIQRYLRAREWALLHREELAQQRSKETGVPIAAIRYGSVAGSVSELAPIDSSVITAQIQVFERYKRAGVIDRIPDLKAGGFDNSFNDLFAKAQPSTATASAS
jgi:sulfonate transport system substrate-binding protein